MNNLKINHIKNIDVVLISLLQYFFLGCYSDAIMVVSLDVVVFFFFFHHHTPLPHTQTLSLSISFLLLLTFTHSTISLRMILQSDIL